MRHSTLFIEIMKNKIRQKPGYEAYRKLLEGHRFAAYCVDIPYPVYCPEFEALMFGGVSVDSADYVEKVWDVKNHYITSAPGAQFWLSMTRDEASFIHINVTFPLGDYDADEINQTFANVIDLVSIINITPALHENIIKHFKLYLTLCELDEKRAEEKEPSTSMEPI